MKLIDKITGFHLEPTNICTLKCAGCARTQFIKQWPQHWKNYNLDMDQLFNFLDIDLTNLTVCLCGIYGDPIYYPELIELVSRLKNYGCHLVTYTNGSYKTKSWWEELTSMFDSNDTIIFSIDGTPDVFTKYRVNGNWESIKVGIETCVKSPCQTVWKFIPFKFNESIIEQARDLSISMGMTKFIVSPSSRFDDETEDLKPSEQYIRSNYVQQIYWKQQSKFLDIDPRCNNQQEHYISADGYYAPCCFAADHRFYYKTIFGKNKQKYNIANTTLTEILESSEVNDFMQNLNKHPVCTYTCTKV